MWFPDIVTGIYQAHFPNDINAQPTLANERLIYAQEIKEILKSDKGVWLLLMGSSMRHGLGYVEYALVNIENPKKSDVIVSGEYFSEEFTPKDGQKAFHVDRITNDITYTLMQDGRIKFMTNETDLNANHDMNLIYYAYETDEGLKVCQVHDGVE